MSRVESLEDLSLQGPDTPRTEKNVEVTHQIALEKRGHKDGGWDSLSRGLSICLTLPWTAGSQQDWSETPPKWSRF